MAQINQYTTTATTIEDGSFFDIDQDQGAGVFQSQKVPPALLKEYFDIPLTTVVSLTSAQILALGTTPKTLLSAPGAGLYYDVDNYRIEFEQGTTTYSNGSAVKPSLVISDPGEYQIIKANNGIYTEGVDTVAILYPTLVWNAAPYSGADNVQCYFLPNQSISIKTIDLATNTAFDPTTGDGTMRVIITYRIKTFGA